MTDIVELQVYVSSNIITPLLIDNIIVIFLRLNK